MNRSIVGLVLKFFLVLALQFFLFSNVQFFGYLTPYYYPVLLLLMPVRYNQHNLLILGFVVGLLVDAFEQTGAIHASATVMMVYLRPVLLRLVSTRGGEDLPRLDAESLGYRNFAIFVSMALFFHHFTLFFLDALKFSNLDLVLWRALQTTVLSFIVVFIIHGLTFRKKVNR